MVEFCRRCGGSLARGDLTFWMGEMFTSADYLCPFCGKSANPEAPKTERPAPEPPAADTDLVFRQGKTETRKAPSEQG
jgi:hypothetical protein